MALPLAGAILFCSPFALVFAVDGDVLGVPAVVAYVFVAWAALILAARSIGRGLLADAALQRRRGRLVPRSPTQPAPRQ